MKVKDFVCVGFGTVGGFISYFVGGFDQLIMALFVTMAIDFLLGVMCGIIGVSPKTSSGHLLSSVAVKGLAKKIYELALVGVGNQVDIVVGCAYFRDAIIFGFLAAEVLSIIENGGLLGVNLPEPVAKMIDVLNKKDGDDNASL